MREYGTNCQQFDNRLGTRKRRATELFNERHGLSAFSAQGFLRDADLNEAAAAADASACG